MFKATHESSTTTDWIWLRFCCWTLPASSPVGARRNASIISRPASIGWPCVAHIFRRDCPCLFRGRSCKAATKVCNVWLRTRRKKIHQGNHGGIAPVIEDFLEPEAQRTELSSFRVGVADQKSAIGINLWRQSRFVRSRHYENHVGKLAVGRDRRR